MVQQRTGVVGREVGASAQSRTTASRRDVASLVGGHGREIGDAVVGELQPLLHVPQQRGVRPGRGGIGA
ncbi:hypothetical protein [Kineococcus sp. NPDC059986]|uniref:hypothetical protein n=1 Tax=Kineococcus sp. NPDC059986 TaxID=3155538 RepID=UPI00344FF9FA